MLADRFPWVASGYAVDGPLAVLAPWVGVYGIGAWRLLAGDALALAGGRGAGIGSGRWRGRAAGAWPAGWRASTPPPAARCW